MAKAKVVTNIDAHAPTGLNARIIAKTRLDEMYAWDVYVDDPYNVHELHNMRIAAKRLRYTLEIFEETFPQEGAQIIQEITQIQEELGAIHDSDVMVALLRLCLGSYDSGVDYEYALKSVAEEERGKAMVNPALLAALVDPQTPPSAEEREGLELLVDGIQKQREEQYTTFHRHWNQLRAQDFQGRVIVLLNS
jgi:CHAD domain-containing protein